VKKILICVFALCISNQISAQSNSFPSTGDVIMADGNLKISSSSPGQAGIRATSNMLYMYSGSYGFAVRKSNNSGDNIFIADGGEATFASDVIMASGHLKLSNSFSSGATYRVTSTNTYIYPGSNGFAVRKMDNSGDNLYITDAGAARLERLCIQ
jgi:hypothetical protein